MTVLGICVPNIRGPQGKGSQPLCRMTMGHILLIACGIVGETEKLPIVTGSYPAKGHICTGN